MAMIKDILQDKRIMQQVIHTILFLQHFQIAISQMIKQTAFQENTHIITILSLRGLPDIMQGIMG